jgi:hypothetical protein
MEIENTSSVSIFPRIAAIDHGTRERKNYLEEEGPFALDVSRQSPVRSKHFHVVILVVTRF